MGSKRRAELKIKLACSVLLAGVRVRALIRAEKADEEAGSFFAATSFCLWAQLLTNAHCSSGGRGSLLYYGLGREALKMTRSVENHFHASVPAAAPLTRGGS